MEIGSKTVFKFSISTSSPDGDCSNHEIASPPSEDVQAGRFITISMVHDIVIAELHGLSLVQVVGCSLYKV